MSLHADLTTAAYLADRIRDQATGRTPADAADLLAWSEELQTIIHNAEVLLREPGTFGATTNSVGLAGAANADSSYDAALRVQPRSGSQRAKVLAELMEWEGLGYTGRTDVQLQTGLKMSPNTERPRRVELVRGGWVKDSGERVKHAGRSHVVWSVTDKARAVYGR